MWEIMWSWLWIKPLPSSEKMFINQKIKENNNKNYIKNWLRASLRRSKKDDKVVNLRQKPVKFLYETKSGKSVRRKSGNYVNYDSYLNYYDCPR